MSLLLNLLVVLIKYIDWLLIDWLKVFVVVFRREKGKFIPRIEVLHAEKRFVILRHDWDRGWRRVTKDGRQWTLRTRRYKGMQPGLILTADCCIINAVKQQQNVLQISCFHSHRCRGWANISFLVTFPVVTLLSSSFLLQCDRDCSP